MIRRLALLCFVVLFLPAAASAAQVLTRSQGVISGTAASGWTFGDGSASHTHRSRPQSQKDTKLTATWTLPTTAPYAGAKGTLTLSITGGDLDGESGAVSVSADQPGAILCTNIVSGGPNSGCNADASNAAAQVTVQPNETKSVTQAFLVGGNENVTLTVSVQGSGGTETYKYTLSGATTTTATLTPASPGGTQLISQTGEVVVRHGSGPWHSLTSGGRLEEGDEIFTGVDSTATLTLPDGSKVRINELSQILLTTLLRQAKSRHIEIQLKLGEINATVKKEKAVDANFEITTPTATAGVRGTVFSVFYDPGSRTSITSVTEGVVAVRAAAGGPVVNVTTGKAVEVTKSVRAVELRGGLDLIGAEHLVLKTIAANKAACGFVTPRTGAFAVKPLGSGWSVSVNAIGGKAKGWSRWGVTHVGAVPINAAARKIAHGCR